MGNETQEETSEQLESLHSAESWKWLTLGALGVVFGDIGTSPLYAMRECFHGEHALEATRFNIFGVLSLIFWALALTVSVKYLVFILRADNHGEGGILALATLLNSNSKRVARRGFIITAGLFGAAFLYADGIITPTVSVLSAVEGLQLAAPAVRSWIEVIGICILIGLFFLQSKGTGRIGQYFGPIMVAWFIVLAVLGLWHISQAPSILAAANPSYAIHFFTENGWQAFLILGTVFLVLTGGESLYSDIGHFGKFPIRVAWFAIVLPALLLNYFGQGSLLLRDPTAADNLFYRLAPAWSLYPVVALGTAAAVVASQAVIAGAFSLTLQAIQLGFWPRLRIAHTSANTFGQIYVPAINWSLMVACIVLVLTFHSSSQLVAAYGVAITITMVITTLLFSTLLWKRWKWHPVWVGPFVAIFLGVDLAFLGSNILKIPYGGWFPILVAGIIFLLMRTWQSGRELLAKRLRATSLSTELFVADLLSRNVERIPGTAIFMTGNPMGTPLALKQNVDHNHILHERIIILGVQTSERPHIPPRERLATEEIGEGFYRATLTYGFMNQPDVPNDLALSMWLELHQTTDSVSYFLGRETLLVGSQEGKFRWQSRLFALMSRNAQPATMYFRIPADRVVEIGVQVEL